MKSSMTCQRARTLSQASFHTLVQQHKRPKSGLPLGLLLALSASLSPALELSLEGELIQGGLMQGITAPGSKVSVNSTPVRVSPDGLFLVGFGRDEASPVRLEVVSPDGETEIRLLEIVSRQYNIQRIDGLPPKKVTPDEEHLKRIRAETALVKATRERDDARTDFLTGFMWPAQGRISGVYGAQRILNGESRRPHFGLDIAAPTGTPVAAPADGVVTLAHPDMFFSGGTIVLDHGHGLSSAFLHLSKVLVAEGQVVRRGDLIGEIGATGRVTGAHLDWRMNLFERRIDPALLVGPMP